MDAVVIQLQVLSQNFACRVEKNHIKISFRTAGLRVEIWTGALTQYEARLL
jgi:hypothetical protein